MWGYLLAAGVAGAVTYLEMDQVFEEIPSGSSGRWKIRGAMAFYVALNGMLALGLYGILSEAGFLETLSSPARGLLVGAGYLSIVRLKFATLDGQPFGFEYLYELARNSAYKRINRRLIDAREEINSKLADEHSLEELTRKANSQAVLDMLTTEEEKQEAKAWILRVIEDDASEERQKKLALADFINSGRRDGHS